MDKDPQGTANLAIQRTSSRSSVELNREEFTVLGVDKHIERLFATQRYRREAVAFEFWGERRERDMRRGLKQNKRCEERKREET